MNPAIYPYYGTTNKVKKDSTNWLIVLGLMAIGFYFLFKAGKTEKELKTQ